MPANPEFVAISSAHYATAGLTRRRAGQRYPARWPVPDALGVLFEGSLPAGWQLELLGVGPGYDSGGQVCQYDHLLVRSPGGQVYPAYRHTTPDNNYAVCQDLNYLPTT